MDIKEILRQHTIWVATEGKLGEEADLCGADLKWAQLQDCSFVKVNLYHADLSESYLEKANFKGADLQCAKLTSSTLRKANLTFTDLSFADLRWSDLTEADFYGANLFETSLTGCNFNSVKNIFRFNKQGGHESFAVVHEHCLMIQSWHFWGTLDEFEKADTGDTYHAQIMYLRELEASLCDK